VRILAIRLARFGDIVLLLPALSFMKTALPGSHLTFLTDTRWGPLAQMCPAIDDVLTIDRLTMRDGPIWKTGSKVWGLLTDLRRRKFDVAIDCHGFRETNLLARWTGAPRRLGLQRFGYPPLPFCFNLPPVIEDKNLHVAEMFVRLAGSYVHATPNTSLPPALVIPPEEVEWARQNLPSSPFVALYVDAPVKERMWPIDRFAALADHILRNLGTPVVVIGGFPARARFRSDVRVLPALEIPRLAATIASARMLVSNDTGPMHLGPLLRIPTVAIFSIGIPLHFRPTGIRDRYVQGNPIERVSLEEVISAADDVWASAR
jgi:ADP-heptose:LPS heptosyltransferase